MVAQFLGLKLRQLANIFRRSPGQVVGIVIGLVYGVGAAIVVVGGLVALRGAPVSLAADISTTAGALIVLGFLLAPLAFGIDDTLDPRAFSLLGMPTRRLAVGLALAALVAVPSLIVVIVSVAQVVTWARGPLPVLLALLGVPLIVATCVLGARVTTSLAAALLSTRRAREASGVVVLLIIVSLSPAVVFLVGVDWAHDGLGVLSSVARAAGWTPLGAVWSAPAEAAAGHPGPALAKLAIAVAFVAVLWFAWRGLVGLLVVSPSRGSRAKNRVGLGWFARMPHTPAGAVAARSITYWLRDPRYQVGLLAIPVAPIVFVVALGLGGVSPLVLGLIPLPVMCVFLAWSVHDDVAYDNSAVWLHVASGTRGAADRLGRLVPVLIVGGVLIVVGAPLTVLFVGDWSILPAIVGVSACILLGGLGLSSVVSARFPYPAVRPGDSPFSHPQATGTSAGLIQSLSFLGTIAVAAPPAACAALGFLYGGQWMLLSLVVGLVVGAAGLYLGVRLGGRVFSRRGPELLALALRN